MITVSVDSTIIDTLRHSDLKKERDKKLLTAIIWLFDRNRQIGPVWLENSHSDTK